MKIKTDLESEKKRVAKFDSMLTMIVTWMVIIVSVAFLIIAVISETRRIHNEMIEVQAEMELLQANNDNLNEEVEYLISENDRMKDTIEAMRKELEDIDNLTIERQVADTQVYASHQTTPQVAQLSMDRNDIQNVTGASREHLLELIQWSIERRYREYSPDHPVALAVDELIAIEDEYGISATTILAISTWESGLCDSEDWPMEYRNANNACGIMDGDYPREFDSVAECYRYTAELLRNSYIDKGYETLYEIGPIYCDESWGPKVAGTLEMYNDKLSDIMN